MARVTEVKSGFGPKDLGEFHAVRFNMFDEDDLEEYSKLRNEINDASKGLKIELMREYSRKTTIREGAGEDAIITTTEEIWLVVHYWQKKPKRNKGDSDEEINEARRSGQIDSATG